MTTTAANNNEQVYNIREDESLSSRVALVLCVLVQRGVYVAGFSSSKELLIIHFSGYSNNKPVWQLDFFEQLIANEPLLAVRDKVKGVFINNHKNIVVPEELYDEAAAMDWLQHIYYVEQQEIMTAYQLENDKAVYLHTIPLNISELVKINFKKAEVLPLSSYHFDEGEVQSLHLQCCVTNEQVTATLHNYSQLLWHKVFDYSCAEDIAYAIRLMCKENYIDPAKLNISCTALAGTEYNIIKGLSQYFPGLKLEEGDSIHDRWAPAISLANQLLTCVL